MERLPASSTRLHLEPQQTLIAAADAGTWLQVRSGVLLAQAPARWLGDTWIAPAHRLRAGAGLMIDEAGWWRFVADHGPVELDCRRGASPGALERFGAALAALRQRLRAATRRLRPS